MTRAAFSGIAQDRAGNGLNGAQITFRAGTEADSPLASVYAAASGGSPLTQPIATDADGRLRVFVPAGVTYRIEGLSEGGAGVDIWAAPSLTGLNYANDAAFIASVAGGYAPPDGTVASDSEFQWVRRAASVEHQSLPGWSLFTKAPPIVLLGIGQSNMNRSYLGVDVGNKTSPLVRWWNGDAATGTVGTEWGDGVEYVNSIIYQAARDIAENSGREVWVIRYSIGATPAVSFVKPATRTANGWELGADDADATLSMYPGIANALAAMPRAPDFITAVLDQHGEADRGQLGVFKQQKMAMLDDLADALLIEKKRTQVLFGQMTDFPSNRFHRVAQRAAMWDLSWEYSGSTVGHNNVKWVDSTEVDLDPGGEIHFSAIGNAVMGRRYAEVFRGPSRNFQPQPFQITAGGSQFVLSDSATGGNLATTLRTNTFYTVHEHLMVDERGIANGGATSATWGGYGGFVEISFNLEGIDTTGMNPGNVLFLQGLDYAQRVGNNYRSPAAVMAANVTGGNSLFATVDPVNPKVIRFFKTSSGGAISTLTVGDLTSGSATLRFVIRYEMARSQYIKQTA